jgi:outer membrane biogenesis lipoprotein LolB
MVTRILMITVLAVLGACASTGQERDPAAAKQEKQYDQEMHGLFNRDATY